MINVNEKAVRNCKLFKTNGLNDILSEKEKNKILDYNEKLTELNLKLKEIQEKEDKFKESFPKSKEFVTIKGFKYTRNYFSVEADYTYEQQAIIFSHGKTNYRLWFLNRAKKLCVIDKATLTENNTIYLSITFDVKGSPKNTCLSLDRFLYLIQIGDFEITMRKFINTYLQPVVQSNLYLSNIERFEAKKAILQKEIDDLKTSDFYINKTNLYDNIKKEVLNNYYNVINQNSRDIAADAAILKKKKSKVEKKQLEIKNIWNSTILDEEKAFFIGWLCKHIKKISIKIVDKGVSDKVLSTAYPDSIYGNKYREKANTSGWDAASGKIKVDSIANAPIETIKKLSTIKHIQHSKTKGDIIFNDKLEINNLDLCLFLLDKYNAYGFKSGVDLRSNINKDLLCKDNFADYIINFNLGLNS